MISRFSTMVVAATLVAGAAQAQQAPEQLGKRVDKLESEMRAVQRKVFPGGDKRFFEPEFPATDQTAAAPAGMPATSPIADLTTRVDSLERQIQTLTGQVEQANFKVRQMEEALAKFRADAEFRLNALEGGGAAKPADAGAAAAVMPEPAAPAPKPAPAPTAAAPKPAVAATAPKPPVAKPATPTETVAAAPADAATPAAKPADPAEAAYQAAYALVSAKRYGEAETALQAFVAKYPKSSRASHAQYWLGRTYMAQKLPAQAAKAYLDNYRNMPKGARAPDSLLGLAGALMAMTPPNPDKACEVYGELEGAYGAKLTADQKAQLARGRTTAKCS